MRSGWSGQSGRCRLLALAAAGIVLSAQSAQADTRRVTLPTWTVVPIRLETALNSRTAQPGDRFSGTVREGRDDGGLPYGTRVEGVVAESLPAMDGKPGILDLEFRRICYPSGESEGLNGSVIGLDARSVRRTESGRLVATTDKSRDRLKMIGIGAGAGLLISALTRSKDTFQNTLLGAAAGYLFNELKKDKPGDVNLKRGTEIGVRLDRALTFTTDRYYGDDYYGDRRDRETDQDRERDWDRNRDSDREREYDRDRERNRDREWDRETDRKEDIFDRRGSGRRRWKNEDRGFGRHIAILLDNRNVPLGPTKPYLRDNVVMVPLEALARAGRFDYRYDASRQMIVARGGSLRLGVGSRVAMLRGERRLLPAAAEIRNGEVFVPMQFAGWAAGGTAYYDEVSRTVVINSYRDYR
jgi:hypothetical protein